MFVCTGGGYIGSQSSHKSVHHTDEPQQRSTNCLWLPSLFGMPLRDCSALLQCSSLVWGDILPVTHITWPCYTVPTPLYIYTRSLELLFTLHVDTDASMDPCLCNIRTYVADRQYVCRYMALVKLPCPLHPHSTSPHSHCERTSLLLASMVTKTTHYSWCQRKCFFSTTCTLWSSSESEHMTTYMEC